MSGMFPRTDAMRAALDNWADILRDECIETDPICGNKSLKQGAILADHLSYFERLTGDFASWVQKKAKLDTGSDFVTAIPTSVSGTVQDYATIGTETPSGGVTMSPDWTKATEVTAVASTAEPSSTKSSGSSSAVETSSGAITSAPTSASPTDPVQGSVSATSSPPPNAAARLAGGAWTLGACGLGALALVM